MTRARASRSDSAALLESIWYGRSAWRWALQPAAGLFRAAAAARRAAYRIGLARSIDPGVPVVVVGNVTVGGTGKTPLIVWLAKQLRAEGLGVGIVSRGYRGQAASWPQRVEPNSDPALVGDEPVLLARRTGCPVIAGPDRVAAARALLSAHPVDVLLSDDGLQHYRMRRAFEIAVVDARRGLGNGLCLPAGPLREPAARLESVDAVVVNGTGDAVAQALRHVDPARIFAATLVPARVYRLTGGDETTLEHFRGRRVHAVAGIGHPERFFSLLEEAGAWVTRRPLPDHAALGREDLEREPGVPALITEKDAVKCRSVDDDLWVVGVEFDMEAGASRRLIGALLDRIQSRGRLSQVL